jgi:hypothetical protein
MALADDVSAWRKMERVMGIKTELAFWAKSTEWPLPGNGSRVHEGPLLAGSVSTWQCHKAVATPLLS